MTHHLIGLSNADMTETWPNWQNSVWCQQNLHMKDENQTITCIVAIWAIKIGIKRCPKIYKLFGIIIFWLCLFSIFQQNSKSSWRSDSNWFKVLSTCCSKVSILSSGGGVMGTCPLEDKILFVYQNSTSRG